MLMNRFVAWARVAALLVILAGVIFSIRWFQSGSADPYFAAMGFGGGASGGDDRFNLCPTRIHAIDWANGARVEERQEGLRGFWRLTKPEDRELSYLDIEKWLSRHCEVTLESGEAAPDGGYTALWTIEYVDGQRGTLEQAGADRFRWNGRQMRSLELSQGVTELAEIAGLPRP